MDENHSLENLMHLLGDFGRYQFCQFLMHVVSAIPVIIHQLSLVTVAGVPDHRCAIPELDSENYTEPWNSSLVLSAIPMKNGKLDACYIFGPNNTLENCDKWIYDNQYFTSSRGIEWNFVCDREWMGAIGQSAFMFGVVLSSLAIAPLCDKYGRKTVFCWTALLQLLIGVAVAFSNDYYLFVILRFIYGIFAIVPFKAGYVLTIELVGPGKRIFCSAIFQILTGIGVMITAVWGYLIDNRFYLQIIYAMHSMILLPHFFLMDESPRWLWAKGRKEECIFLITKALKFNKSSENITILPPLLTNPVKLTPKVVSESSSVLDLFKTPNMLKKTLIICNCWFAIALVYYGLSLNIGKFDSNPYLMLFLIGLVELPGYTGAMCFLNRLGHRTLLSTTMIVSGISLLTIVAIQSQTTISIVLVMVGKLFICGSYSVIYKYATEIFPTVLRASGVGLGNTFANLSAAVSSLITLLDSFNPTIPIAIFGILSVVLGFCSLMLPETLGHRLPETLEDAESFGVNDSFLSNCTRRINKNHAGNFIRDETCNQLV